ncbi:caspase-2 [Biomphalaria glabrata]|uniref:Uncharacterized protein LOC106061941 isoform X1 n=2 Tax=Biomphalaria glabrata TaxID=6526 RepID=A0A9W2YRY4_BIOGL|nr:uncharacterized protein LOC106061941 isoform X1 [Biomphalaria glabrata]XP_055865383.1 uncharacterized protein LOC106061941 isoform X1 [Biomphalaria glabrata]XP_055865389.1 uncharacterized protein LOC106061941 isoform X1 [Biomphalaria glabrata]KAI8768899.1 CAunnamed protein product [Biomphalaria glabrata]KAI8789129.1 CAunnamed protein product [Biomphalaria glabrata]
MADKNKSIDDIQEKIKRLQKEKDELERQNRERQQIEQLKSLEESISALKSTSSFNLQSNRDIADGSAIDTHNHSRSSNQNRYMSDLSDNQENSRERCQFSDEECEEDEAMTTEHKKAILENRDVLVENIIADDIFSELIAKRVLSISDVNRIKEKSGAEAKNEELLNVISKRSDKAFFVFVDALRKTLQGWLANKLDPPSSKSKMKRKRKSGEVRVNVDCESITPSTQKKMKCSCLEVEELMLQMAKNAYANIKRKDPSPAAYEQFKKELEGTNKLILEATEVTNAIKMLCKHGKLTDISDGSVCFTLRCKSLAACEELWEAFISGRMLHAFQSCFISPSLLKECGAKSIKLCLRISHLEYLTCALEIAQEELNHLSVTPIKLRLRKNRNKANLGKSKKAFRRSLSNDSYKCQHISSKLMVPVQEHKTASDNIVFTATEQKMRNHHQSWLKLRNRHLTTLSNNISNIYAGSTTNKTPVLNTEFKKVMSNWNHTCTSFSVNKENSSLLTMSDKWNSSHYNLRVRN